MLLFISITPKKQIMSYQFKGNLKGLLCDKYCIEAIAGVKIRIYRAEASREVVLQAAAAAKEKARDTANKRK